MIFQLSGLRMLYSNFFSSSFLFFSFCFLVHSSLIYFNQCQKLPKYVNENSLTIEFKVINQKVAHVCALLRRNVIGYKISKLILNNDPLLFPILKNNPNAESDLQKLNNNLLNSTIKSVGRHGKHFWLRLQSPTTSTTSVLLMHFGMTGMVKIRNVKSHLVFMENGGDKKILEEKQQKKEDTKQVSSENAIDIVEDAEEEWPPRFVKMEMELSKDGNILEFAFVDPRRLGRMRYLSGPEVQTDEGLLKVEPLSKLGPDYSKKGDDLIKKEEEKEVEEEQFVFGDPDPEHHGKPRLSLVDFNKLVLSKKKPIKALLQEQELFSGVGNWVSDEIVYQARIHPSEVLSSKIAYVEGEIDPVISKLYEALIYVSEESVKIEGDVTQFPDHWLMLFRWGKRRKNGPKAKTNDGNEVDYLTVGGRTSCFVPKLQKLLPVKKRSNTDEDKKVQTKRKKN